MKLVRAVDASTPGSLARRQQALLSVLFASGRGASKIASEFIANYAVNTAERGFTAYRSNVHQLAERSLQSTYPVVAQLLGVESFAVFSRVYWHAHPPLHGDLALWGGQLATFITANDQLADTPYLADVARVEWALHTSATAADTQADLATLQLLVAQDPAELQGLLAPGMCVVHSPWSVASIVAAHLGASGPPDLSDVAHKLREGVAETTVVWRHGFKPRCRLALPGEGTFLMALHEGQSFGQALDLAAPAFDFASWLPLAVATGLLLAVRLHPVPRSSPFQTEITP